MRNDWFGPRTAVGIGIALAIVLSLPMLSSAQAPAGRGRGAAAATAKPAPPAAPAPRFRDGTINLDAVPGQKGFWNAFNGQLVGKTGNALPTNLEVDQVPFRPWAKALYEFRKFRNGLDDPHSRCQPAGGLRFWNAPNGTEFIQDPDHNRILLLDGENRDWKRIAMEPGRKHPSEDDLNPSYFGDAIGHWALDLARCAPYSSPYGYQFVMKHMENILDTPDPAKRFERVQSMDTFMIWQSMLRGVGIYSGCTRCYDVCPVGADYEQHLKDVQESIPEETAEKQQKLRAIQSRKAGAALSSGLRQHLRWIGRLE